MDPNGQKWLAPSSSSLSTANVKNGKNVNIIVECVEKKVDCIHQHSDRDKRSGGGGC